METAPGDSVLCLQSKGTTPVDAASPLFVEASPLPAGKHSGLLALKGRASIFAPAWAGIGTRVEVRS
jgi:hypothetical protein